MTGGIGREDLSHFYLHNFIFNNSADTELELISRIKGIDRIVDEFIFKFTHDQMIDWMYVYLFSFLLFRHLGPALLQARDLD
jgi:carboxymethylenebutenolidase